MNCPICDARNLGENDGELICEFGCGSTFVLNYVGMYEEGSDDRIDSGHESQEFKDKYLEKINKEFPFRD